MLHSGPLTFEFSRAQRLARPAVASRVQRKDRRCVHQWVLGAVCRERLSQTSAYHPTQTPETSGPVPKMPPKPHKLPELALEQNTATPTTAPAMNVAAPTARARRTNPGGETPTFGPGARRWMAMQTPANSSPSPSTIGPTETTWFNRAPTRRLTSGASRREK
jgi:hypothetical protein